MKTSLAIGCTLLLVAISPLEAAIVSHSVNVEVISPPASVANESLQSDSKIWIFPERQRVKIPGAGQAFNATPSVRSNHTWVTPPYESTAASHAGTIVSSYFIHFDPVLEAEAGTSIVGEITFDSDILGIIVGNTALDSTDGRFRLETVDYGTDDFRGLEGSDRTELPSGNRKLILDIAVTSFSDNVRVVTAATNADFNEDGHVDGADFLIWQRNAGRSAGAMLSDGDSNVDGAVDQYDLDNWRFQFGTATFEPTANVAIPEPTTAILTCCCVWPLLLRRSRGEARVGNGVGDGCVRR